MVLVIKNLPANLGDIGVHFLHWEDTLEEGMTAHYCILSWRIPWTEKAGELWSI